jgi:hypothetical protein
MSMDYTSPPPPPSPVIDVSRASTNATLSLVLGIAGLVGVLGGCCCCLSHILSLCAPIAAVLGYMEKKAIDEGRSSPAGRGTAQAGMVLGIVGTGLIVLYFIGVVIWIIISGFSAVMETLTRGHWSH